MKKVYIHRCKIYFEGKLDTEIFDYAQFSQLLPHQMN